MATEHEWRLAEGACICVAKYPQQRLKISNGLFSFYPKAKSLAFLGRAIATSEVFAVDPLFRVRMGRHDSRLWMIGQWVCARC